KLKLTERAQVVAAMPVDAAALRAAIEKDVVELKRIHNHYGLTELDTGLLATFEKRRQSMGLAADGSGRKLESAELSGITLLPEADRAASSAKSPLTPENAAEKVRIAFPELKNSAEVEAKLREMIPQWDYVRPKSPLLAQFKKMDEKRSKAARQILDMVDYTELHSVKQGRTEVMMVFDDKPLKGLSYVTTRKLMAASSVINGGSFDTRSLGATGNIDKRKYTLTDLSDDGVKEAMELAVALKERMDTKDISAADKTKYKFFLESLKTLTKQRANYFKDFTLDSGGQTNWAKLHSMLESGSVTLGKTEGKEQETHLSTLNPMDWLSATLAAVSGSGRSDAAAQLPGKADDKGSSLA
ncbi:MAG: hypothetical protein K2Q01_08080, partial [Rickettsiales bacterium]|nr:hypothetical protein [Rickettsiales bacterium]